MDGNGERRVSATLRVGQGLALALAFGFLAWLGIELSRESDRIATFWFADALLIATLLRAPKNRWLEFVVWSFAGNFVANRVCGNSYLVSSYLPALNVLESWGVAALTTRLILGKFELFRTRHVISLAIVASFTVTTGTAALASIFINGQFGTPILSVWRTWFLADTLGLATFGPLFVAAFDAVRSTTAKDTDWKLKAVEEISLLTSVCLLSYFVFHQAQYPLLFLLMPVILVLTFRLGVGMAAFATGMITTIGLLATLNGHGPIAVTRIPAHDQVILFQIFSASVFFIALPIGAYFAEREALLKEMEKARDAANAAAKAKASFLAAMSHEVRTPMTGVLGMAQLLRQEESPTKRREYLDALESSAHAMVTMLNSVLDISKIEADKLVLEQVDVNLTDLVGEVAHLFSSAAEAKNLSIVVDVPDREHAEVLADPTRLRQILSNLVANAIKFTEEGVVEIRLTCQDEAENRHCILEVADSGIGIAPEHHGVVFEAFRQADSSTTRQYGGTGLGLAITRELVQVMGGTIRFESAVGRGTRFFITLDFPGRPASILKREEDERSASVVGLKVLVAEDNPTNQLLIRSWLRRQGHDPFIVGDGASAVECALKSHFDVVLMDIQMPLMDGFEATSRIRAFRNERSKVPIVALTADVGVLRDFQVDPKGFSACLTKPIDFSQLNGLLIGLMGQGPEGSNPEALETDGVFEIDRIEMIRETLGEETLAEILQTLARDIKFYVTELTAAYQHGDLDRFRRTAHSLKGASSTAGAGRLAALGARYQHAEDLDSVSLIEIRFEADAAIDAAKRLVGDKDELPMAA